MINSWKVINIKPRHQLTLLFGMKAPGLGCLTFTIKDCGKYRTLDVRAWWHAVGFFRTNVLANHEPNSSFYI